ncbi:MAG TPA: N-acetylmuramoyl-L-alanine amidase [Vicinamibacterales bacterium]
MRSFARLAIGALLLASTMPVVLAQPSQSQRIYNEALERERTLRKELEAPSATPALLTRLRALVGAYEDMSKLFSGSDSADNALWQGARLSADAFWEFGDAVDRSTALRLFTRLTTRFPASTFARQVPEQTKRLNDARPNPPASQTDLAQASAPPTPPAIPARPPATGTASLTAIRRDVLPEALRITLELAREVTFYDERIDGPPRVFIDLQNTRAVDTLKDAVIPFSDDVVKQVRIGRQADARTRVVLDLRGAGRYSIYTLYDPYRIVVDFERQTTGSDAIVARNGGRGAAPLRAGGPLTKPTDTAAPARARSTPASQTKAAPASTAAIAPTSNPPIAPTGDRGIAPTTVSAIAPTNEAPIAPTDDSGIAPITERAIASATAPPVVPLETATVPPPAAPLPPSANRNGSFSLSRQLGLGIAKIVIDAGHGGHDPGAQARGITEAELTLDLALRLEKLLSKEAGFEVVMTRRTDTFVSLEERTAIANRGGADLFLSIHSNASSAATARGIETYFLNFAPNPEAEAVAARENAGGSRNMRSLPEIVRAIALNNKIDESRDFASIVQNAMYTQMRKSNKELRNLGVKQAPFLVLIGATMPSILAEVSFITNRQDALLLKTDKYRQQIAEALYNGVLKYQQSLKRVPAIATK